MPSRARSCAPVRRNGDVEDAAVLGRKLPAHAFLEQYRKGSWFHRLEFKRSLTVVDSIVPRHPDIIVTEQGQGGRVIAGNPEFPSRPIFPEMNVDRLIECRIDSLAVAL